MKRLIMATLLCSVAMPAQAGPIIPFIQGIVSYISTGAVVASGIGGAFAAGSQLAAFFGSSLLGQLALSVGLSAISSRLSRPKMPPPADRMRNFAQARAPMDRIYGRVRKGGPMAFTGFRTSVQQITGGTLAAPVLTSASKRTRYNVILIAAHSTKGPVQWYLDSREAEVSALGEITTPPMAGYGALRAYTGKPGQVVDPVLDAVFIEVTPAFDFSGLSYAMLEARSADGETFNNVYPGGKEWDVAPVWDGHDQIYDPRDGLLKYTNNAALIIAAEAAYFGKSVDWDEVATEADVCDQIVTNGDGGTQRRWTINATLDDTMPWESVRDQLGLACGAYFYQRADGKLGFKVGRWIEPTLTLTDRDFLSLLVGDQDWGPDVPGEFVVNYVEPSRQWREAPSGAFVAQAGGARMQEDCYAIDSHNQASRIAKLMSRSLRPRYTVSGTMKLIGYEAMGQRFIRIASEGQGEITVEVRKLERQADGITFSFEGRSAAALDYEFNAAVEEPPRPINLDVVNSDEVVPVIGLTGAVIEGTGGVAQIEWRWTAPGDTALRQQIRIRSIGAGMTDWQLAEVGAVTTSFVTTGLVDGAFYDGQVRNRAASGRVSGWSDTVTVQAVANSTAPAALSAFAVAVTGGGADLTFTAPNDPLYYATRIYRGPTTTFADASTVQTEFGAPGGADAWTDPALAAGTYSYWGEPINASGIAGPRSGPNTITI